MIDYFIRYKKIHIQYASRKKLQNQSYEIVKEKNKTSKTYWQNKLMALQLRIGQSFESLKLMPLAISKGDYMIKGCKMESKIFLSPSNARKWGFKVQQTCMKSLIKEKTHNYEENNE